MVVITATTILVATVALDRTTIRPARAKEITQATTEVVLVLGITLVLVVTTTAAVTEEVEEEVVVVEAETIGVIPEAVDTEVYLLFMFIFKYI